MGKLEKYSDIKVSVIIPVYKSEEFLDEVLRSVQMQTHKCIEVIVVFDGYSHLFTGFESKYRNFDGVQFFQLSENRGAGFARNVGLEKVTGQYVAFLDSDDLWCPQKIELQLEFMRLKDVKVSCTSYQVLKDHKPIRIIRPRKNIDFYGISLYCDVGNSTVMIETNLLRKFGYMIGPKEDYRTWMNLCRNGTDIIGYDKILTDYRIRSDSVSANKIGEVIKQYGVLREIGQVSVLCAVYCLLIYTIRGLYVRFR